jgi:transcriptional regulator with XRE-family HTH domain
VDDIYALVGKRLRAIRQKRLLTQAVVSERAGISSPFLSFLENGRKKGSLESYHKLAGALDVRLDELFREAPPPALTPAADYGPSLKGLKTAERRAVFALVRSLRRRP